MDTNWPRSRLKALLDAGVSKGVHDAAALQQAQERQERPWSL